MLSKQAMKHYMGSMSLVLVFVFILSTEARAVIYPFEAVYPVNSATYADAIAAQLSVEVEDSFVGEVGDQVLFTFRNSGNYDSSIHEVYFEDGALMQIYDDPSTTGTDSVEGIINDIYDVYFQKGANPSNLPGNLNVSPPFYATEAFSVDNTTQNSYGVEPGEELGIVFDFVEGKSFADVLAAINLGFTTSNPSQYDDKGNLVSGTGTTLRIGLHVGGFPDGESDSFIMTPIPSAVLLGILGLGVAGLKLRKFA